MSKFKVWVDDSYTEGSTLTWDAFDENEQRQQGFKPKTIISSQMMNSVLRSTSLVVAALMDLVDENSELSLRSSVENVKEKLSKLTSGSEVLELNINDYIYLDSYYTSYDLASWLTETIDYDTYEAKIKNAQKIRIYGSIETPINYHNYVVFERSGLADNESISGGISYFTASLFSETIYLMFTDNGQAFIGVTDTGLFQGS